MSRDGARGAHGGVNGSGGERRDDRLPGRSRPRAYRAVDLLVRLVSIRWTIRVTLSKVRRGARLEGNDLSGRARRPFPIAEQHVAHEVDPRRRRRREFLGELAGSAALLAGAGLVASPIAAQQATSSNAGATPQASPRAETQWDVSWVDRLSGRHKQVFDAPEISEGTILHQARTWMRGYADVYQTTDADTNAVLVIRHAAVPMVLKDEVWDRMDWGKQLKLKDPTTGKHTRRNPFINVKRDDKHSMVWPDGGLDTLISRGCTVLACNLALMGQTGRVAEKLKLPREEARKLVFDNLLSGVIVMPSGIFAIGRAQEAGCHYIRST